MNNDLISRSALRGIIETYRPIKCFTDKDIGKNRMVDFCLAEIDNAPKVFSCNACKNMGNERECVDCHDYSNYVHYEERPQGEWGVYGKQGDTPITDRCTNCNYEMKWYKNKYNFCPNCGAKMKGGE